MNPPIVITLTIGTNAKIKANILIGNNHFARILLSFKQETAIPTTNTTSVAFQ